MHTAYREKAYLELSGDLPSQKASQTFHYFSCLGSLRIFQWSKYAEEKYEDRQEQQAWNQI